MGIIKKKSSLDAYMLDLVCLVAGLLRRDINPIRCVLQHQFLALCFGYGKQLGFALRGFEGGHGFDVASQNAKSLDEGVVGAAGHRSPSDIHLSLSQ